MEIQTINNSSSQEIERAITWQFDNAQKLVGIIHLIKDFTKKANEDFWDVYKDVLNLFNSDSTDEFALSVWGNILNIARPTIGEDDDATYISASLYKTILKATYDLNNSAYSLADINQYIHTIGLDDIGFEVSDSGVMSLSYITITPEETSTELELLAATGYFNKLPAAVDNDDWEAQTVFGFSGQVESAGTKYIIVWFNGSAGSSIPSLTDNGSTVAPISAESDSVLNADGIGHALYVVSTNYNIADITIDDFASHAGITYACNFIPTRTFPTIGKLAEDADATGSVFASAYTL